MILPLSHLDMNIDVVSLGMAFSCRGIFWHAEFESKHLRYVTNLLAIRAVLWVIWLGIQ